MQTLPMLAGLTVALALQQAGLERNETWADLDGDGREDLITTSHGGSLRALLADADGQLNPADPSWGLDGLLSIHQVAASDYDGDGRTDLFLASSTGQHRLLRHTGTSFVDVTQSSGLSALGPIESAAWLDYDDDGDPDLRLFTPGGALAICRNLGESRFQSMSMLAPVTPGVSASGGSPAESSGFASSAPGRANEGSRGAPSPLGRPLGGDSPVANAGSGPGSYNVSAAPGGMLSTPCLGSIADQAGGNCIEASRTPTEGKLFPNDKRLFVGPFGQIGINSLNPTADLHIDGGTVGTLLLRSYSFFSGTGRSEIQLGTGPGEFDEGMKTVATDAGLDIYSRRLTQGGSTDYGPHLTVSRGATTRVGVSEPAPATTLHVGGQATVDDTLHVRRPDGVETVAIDPDYAGGGGSARMYMHQSDGALGLVLDGENSVNSGSKITMYGNGGTLRVELDADDAGAAFMRLYRADNTVGITLDADQNGDARITTQVLEITGGADLAESFDTGNFTCQPGTVVVIDPERPGELAPSTVAYDARVAGVVSGAGGVQAGLHLGQTGVAAGSTPVALTGRVYVRCCDENGPVRPGDMLTTSSTPGVAMRATDAGRSFGAVIGKAMGVLDGESGLVLTLVNLQ